MSERLPGGNKMHDNKKYSRLHLERTIVLIGFMGTGKTTIGRLLSDISNLPFYDTDELIEHHEGIPISDIFQQKGESYFRALEKDILKDALDDKQKVLATGGGITKDPVNVKLIKSKSIAVALHSDLETIIKRLEGTSKRPLLPKQGFEKKLKKLYNERAQLYDFAHLTVQTQNKTALEIATEIYKSITEK